MWNDIEPSRVGRAACSCLLPTWYTQAILADSFVYMPPSPASRNPLPARYKLHPRVFQQLKKKIEIFLLKNKMTNSKTAGKKFLSRYTRIFPPNQKFPLGKIDQEFFFSLHTRADFPPIRKFLSQKKKKKWWIGKLRAESTPSLDERATAILPYIPYAVYALPYFCAVVQSNKKPRACLAFIRVDTLDDPG